MKINRIISNNKNHYKGVNKCLYITIHETGNTNVGAGALSHAKYINGGSPTSWHYTVDDKEVIQHFEDTTQCWHCGDGRGNGNLNSIGVEMCVNSDGDMSKTIENTIELIKHLMNKHKIPISKVVQHNHWSKKDCPRNIRKGKPINWNTFISMIENKSNDDVIYVVQVGAYKNKNNAINMQNDLKKKGYESFITIK